MIRRPRRPGLLACAALVVVACSSSPMGTGHSAPAPEVPAASPAPAAAIPAASVGCSGGRAPALTGCPPLGAAAARLASLSPDELDSAHPGSWPEPSEFERSPHRNDTPAGWVQSPTALLSGETGFASGVAAPSEVDPERALAAIAKETLVHEAPSHRSRKVGYLRAGAVVSRDTKPAGTEGCSGGWYAIEPEGFVCVGHSATLTLEHPIVAASRRRPDRNAALPYEYGMSRFPPPPFYVKAPTQEEQRRSEPDLRTSQRPSSPVDWEVALEELPALLRDGRQSPTLRRFERPLPGVTSGVAMPKSGFAFLSFFEHEGRRWGLSVDLEVMPLDRLRRIEPSRFRGVVLDAEHPLPLVFVRGYGQSLLSVEPGAGLQKVRALAYREAVHVSGRSIVRGGLRYLVTRDGYLLKDENLVRIEAVKRRPGWAKPGRSWIEVSILQQSLVAYEGDTPVYATLVSTGADGLGDPKKTHSTVRGQFLIHTKHVTTSMSGEEVGDEFDLRDVPYVQYFTEGYALHAAYWHDAFGLPKSHGCINLSPLDAAWLFEWTDPQVPEAWHGAMTLSEGTLLDVRP